MDPVRADYQVVATGRAVREAHTRRPAALQAGHGRAEPNGHLRGRLAKHLMEGRAPDRDAAAHTLPHPVDIDVGKKTAGGREAVGVRSHFRAQPGQIRCRAHRALVRRCLVSRDRRRSVPFSRPVDKLSSDAALVKGASQREAGNAGSDDQDAQGRYARPAFPARARGRMFRFERNRLYGSYSSLTSTSRSILAP